MLSLMRIALRAAARHGFPVAAALIAGAVGCGSAFTSATTDGGASGGDASAGSDAAGGGGDGGSAGRDAGGDGSSTTVDGGVSGDAGASGGGVQCGPNKSCFKGETCCVYDNNSNFNYVCRQTSGCPSGSSGASVAELACANSADCGGIGHACCIEKQNNNVFLAFCAGSCASPQAQMCSPNASISACIGPPCSSNNIDAWGLPNLYGTCGGVSP